MRMSREDIWTMVVLTTIAVVIISIVLISKIGGDGAGDISIPAQPPKLDRIDRIKLENAHLRGELLRMKVDQMKNPNTGGTR